MPLKYKASCHYCKMPLFPGNDVRYVKMNGWIFWCDNNYCEKQKKKTCILDDSLLSSSSSYSHSSRSVKSSKDVNKANNDIKEDQWGEEDDEEEDDNEYNDQDRAELDKVYDEVYSDESSEVEEAVIVQPTGLKRIPKNYLFCYECNEFKHPDSFSDNQRKFGSERYCLAHTATSGFNRSYRKAYVPPPDQVVDSDIEPEDSDSNESLQITPPLSKSKSFNGHNSDRPSSSLASSHRRTQQPSSSSSAAVVKATREVISIGNSSDEEDGVADDAEVDSSSPKLTRTVRRRLNNSQDSRTKDVLTPVKATSSSSSSSHNKVQCAPTSSSSSSNYNRRLSPGAISRDSGRDKIASSGKRKATLIDIEECLYNTDDDVEVGTAANRGKADDEEESDDDDDVIFSPCGKRIKLS